MLTVGALQAGTKENIIPDDATIKLNMRTFDEDVRGYMLGAIRRICCAECMASNAPKEPEFTTISSYPLTVNDADTTEHLRLAFESHFSDNAYETKAAAASEDFSIFGREWEAPYAFWFVGGTDPDVFRQALKDKKINEIPSNHSPKYAPVLHPTLRTGLEAMLCAAESWLGLAHRNYDNESKNRLNIP